MKSSAPIYVLLLCFYTHVIHWPISEPPYAEGRKASAAALSLGSRSRGLPGYTGFVFAKLVAWAYRTATFYVHRLFLEWLREMILKYPGMMRGPSVRAMAGLKYPPILLEACCFMTFSFVFERFRFPIPDVFFSS